MEEDDAPAHFGRKYHRKEGCLSIGVRETMQALQPGLCQKQPLAQRRQRFEGTTDSLAEEVARNPIVTMLARRLVPARWASLAQIEQVPAKAILIACTSHTCSLEYAHFGSETKRQRISLTFLHFNYSIVAALCPHKTVTECSSALTSLCFREVAWGIISLENENLSFLSEPLANLEQILRYSPVLLSAS